MNGKAVSQAQPFPAGAETGSFVRSEADSKRNLLRVEYRGRVTPEMMRRHLAEVDEILSGLEDGFAVLTDLSGLERMDSGCSADLSRVMEAYAARRIASVIRVIPNPSRDIGFSILSLFHYPSNVRIVTCSDMEEAERLLSEGG